MKPANIQGSVVSVCKNKEPGLPKYEVTSIRLIKNYGVEGDYHAGKFVRHRYLAKKDPTKPNIYQVLIIDKKILAEIKESGIQLKPGMLGENIIVEGISIMELSIGSQLRIGETLLEITEIRSPCLQLNEMHPRLLKAVATKVHGKVRVNAGMMARILIG
ncbi:MOSC domain-containing protein, partial [Chloroflexota bacterium]